LGRGKGFFDRFLPCTRAIVAGVAYLEQILPAFPMEVQETHDVRMVYLVTASGVLPAQSHYRGEEDGVR